MTSDRPKPSESGVAWSSADVASSWQRGAAARGQALGPVTELMLDLAGVTVGSRVLGRPVPERRGEAPDRDRAIYRRMNEPV